LPGTVEQQFCDELAPELYAALLDILGKMRVNAHVSYSVTEEVVIHFWRDMERLYATHHEKVHVTKSCSYAAFWIRKLKPISDAYPEASLVSVGKTEVPPHEAEITDINEQVAIHLSLTLMRNCIRDNRIIRVEGVEKASLLAIFDRVAADYLTSEMEDGMSMGPRFASMVYDMRFRTYGPHHLTHFLVHITRDIYKECAK
jgi:hypothetical protein